MIEKWKRIKEFPHYKISNFGRVKILPRIKILKGKILNKFNIGRGYAGVTLYHYGRFKAFPIHKLVTKAFLGTCPKGKEVNHRNGNKMDSRLKNLEYVSHLENVLHGYNRRSKCVLTKKDVIKIRKLISVHVPIVKITSVFKISPSTVCDIKYGRTWKWFKQ